MEKALTMAGIPNVFRSRPLRRDELGAFYFGRTMPVRTGDPYADPMDDIYDACTAPPDPDDTGPRKPFLLLGNRGCGKSTELSRLSARLMENGYWVHTVQCKHDLDLRDPVYTDLLILMGEALMFIANGAGCTPDKQARETIQHFWADVERTITKTMTGGASAEAGLSGELAPKLFLKFFGELKANIGVSDERTKVYRETIRRRLSEWMAAMNSIADTIAKKLNGKLPVIIFEDLDKLTSKEVWQVFYHDGVKLTGFRFPVIYTFPSAFALDDQFNALELDFTAVDFPMIRLVDEDGRPNEPGYDAMMEIIKRRADLSLFDDGVLRLLIEKTGGSLRDLFDAIFNSFKRANRRGSSTIAMEDAESALRETRYKLCTRVDSEQYDFLRTLYQSKEARRQIQERKMTLDLLDKRVVLDQGGWRSVHPLVVDFLKEQGVIVDKRTRRNRV